MINDNYIHKSSISTKIRHYFYNDQKINVSNSATVITTEYITPYIDFPVSVESDRESWGEYIYCQGCSKTLTLNITQKYCYLLSKKDINSNVSEKLKNYAIEINKDDKDFNHTASLFFLILVTGVILYNIIDPNNLKDIENIFYIFFEYVFDTSVNISSLYMIYSLLSQK